MLPDDVVGGINSFNDTQWLKFIDAIMYHNCYLVEVSPIESACFHCNTNGSKLAAPKQTWVVLFYLLKHIIRDATPLAQAVAMVAAAIQHIDVCPSVADDCHTADRRAKYFLQSLTDNLTGLTEVSSPQAASSLLGMAPITSSINTFFALSGMPFVIRIH
jgi:hypothetical protein